jgi:hypothetical protein
MNGRLTPRDVKREYTLKLQDTEARTLASDVKKRLRLRRRLRRAIEDMVRIEGGTDPLAREFAVLIRSAKVRLNGRACC